MKACIKHISYVLPETVLSNEDLNKEFPDWSVDKISEKTGIHNRHIAPAEVLSSDLGVDATEKLFQEFKVDRSTVDYVILCTQSPDYYLPTTACLLQARLGLPTSCGAIDINQGCSGYIYGLGLSKALIETGQARNILFITAETYSKFIHPKDKSIRTIFGDGAACSLVTLADRADAGIFSFCYGTDGSGANNLIVKGGSLRERNNQNLNHESLDAFGNTRTEANLYMNGQDIFSFTLRSVPQLIKDVLAKNELTSEQIDLYILHQANKFMLEALRKKIGIPDDKFFVQLENCGNTVSSTIPIAIYEAIKSGKAKPGSTLLLAGFGVGYSWGATIIKL
jgi:3-oxoacyl-[acyl-carrier-protein] synthase III